MIPTHSVLSTHTSAMFKLTHPRNFTFSNSVNSSTNKNDQTQGCYTRACLIKLLILLLILLSGDIQTNPGLKNQSIFPCGTCDVPCKEGVC